MCTLNQNRPPLPIGAGIFYRRSTGLFKPGLQHVFELAIYAQQRPVPMPGEIQLQARLKLRFGKDSVGLRVDAAAAAVFRIVSEPLTKECGKRHVADSIAAIVHQHYGRSIPIKVWMASGSICTDRAPSLLAA